MNHKRKAKTVGLNDENNQHNSHDDDQQPEHDGIKLKQKRKRASRDERNGNGAAKRTCSKCKVSLGWESFNRKQWREEESTRECKSCCTHHHQHQHNQQQATKKSCNTCKIVLDISDGYSKAQWKTALKYNACKTCALKAVPKHPKKTCQVCKVSLGKESFSKQQWKDAANQSRCCKDCGMNVNAGKKEEMRGCQDCGKLLIKISFSVSQWKGGASKLRSCKSCNLEKLKVASNYQKNKVEGAGRGSSKSAIPNGDSNGKGKGNTIKAKGTKDAKNNKKSPPKFETDPSVISRTLSDRINVLPENQQRKSFDFQWDSSPISQNYEDTMAKVVVQKGRYGRITDEEKTHIHNYIQKFSIAMTVPQACSLRSTLLQQKAMYRHAQLELKKKMIYTKYKQGASILDLSQLFDQPPMNVFRTILAMMNYSKKKIKKCLRDPKNELKSREQREFAEAENADGISNINKDRLRVLAEAFEDIISNFLEERGILFVRQEQLEVEQKKTFGKSILTPDFLFLDKVEINGKQVTWIDAKAFYGANIQFNIKKMRKQMSRYIDHWGGGAIMYLQGFNENLAMEGCTMLSAQDVISAEDLSPLERIKKIF